MLSTARPHVTIGKAETVWRVERAMKSGRLMLARVSSGGRYHTRSSVDPANVTAAGEHELRATTDEQPQNCPGCGFFREVRR